MAEIETINIFPPPKDIDIGKLEDNDRPVFDPIDIVIVPDASIGYYGYITKRFKNVKQIVSPRHRDGIGLKNIFSNYFLKKKIEINEPALSIANGWYDNFYHFSLECLVKLYILKKYEGTLVVFPSGHSKFHKEWMDILNIKNILYINENEVVRTPLAISSNFPNRDLNHHHIILPEFRNWVLSKLGEKQPLNFSKLFIGRKLGSKRNLTNQKELFSELEKNGFKYIEIEDFPLREQVNIFRNAKAVVAVHGASLTHLTFCDAGVKVLDLIHENYHVFCFLKLAKILDLKYELMFCKGEKSEKEHAGYRDFHVDINAVLKIVKEW